MTRKEIKDLFERGVEDVVEVDFVDAARQGAERTRRRRMTLALTSVFGLAAAGVVGVAVLGGLPEGGDRTPPAETSVGLPEGTQAPVGDPVLLVFSEVDLRMVPGGIAAPATADDLRGVSWRLQRNLTLPGTTGDPAGDPRFEPSSLATTMTFDGQSVEIDATCLRMSAPAELGSGGRLEITGDWFVDPDPAPGAACVETAEQWDAREQSWQRLLGGGPLLSTSGSLVILTGFTGVPAEGEERLVPVQLTVERAEAAVQGQEPTGPWTDLAGIWRDASSAPTEGQLRLGSEMQLRIVGGDFAGRLSIESGCGAVSTGATWLRTDGVLLSDGAEGSWESECPDVDPESREAVPDYEAVLALLHGAPTVTSDGETLRISGLVRSRVLPHDGVRPTTPPELAGGETLVFQRSGSTDWPQLPGQPPFLTVPDPEDILGSWQLVGHLGDGWFASPGGIVGVDVSTALTLTELGDGGVHLGVTPVGCGMETRGGGRLGTDDTGRFEGLDLIVPDAACTGEARRAAEFWAAVIAGGGWLHQTSDDTLLLTVDVPVEVDARKTGDEPTASGDAVPLGAGLALTAVPEGWTLVHRGSLDGAAGAVTSCLVFDGLPSDPAQGCEVEVTAGSFMLSPWGPAGTLGTSALPCWADPEVAMREPAATSAQLVRDSRETGEERLEGGTDVHVERWTATCADGRSFAPQVWWTEDLNINVLDYGGRLDVRSLLDGIVEVPGSPILTTDARITTVDGQTLDLATYRVGDGAVGAGEPSGRASYSMSDGTQCLLHDTDREPGQDLSLTACEALVVWLGEHVEEQPYVTLITQGEELLQVRTLYVP